MTSVAARAVIEVIEEENLLENTHVVGGYFRSKLEELKEKHPLIGDVRGMGMMQGLELVRDRQTKEPAPAETSQLLSARSENGLLIGKGGLYGNVIRMAPPDEHWQGRRGRRHPTAGQILRRITCRIADGEYLSNVRRASARRTVPLPKRATIAGSDVFCC